MIDTRLLPSEPSADDFAGAARRRSGRFILLAIALALALGLSYISFGLDSPVLPLLLLLAVATPVALWRWPRMVLYVSFGAVCLIELFPIDYGSSLSHSVPFFIQTDRIPFFPNINTVIQTYTAKPFKALPVSVFEIFVVLAGICSLFRSVYTRRAGLRGGALLAPIGLYMGFVALGWIIGLATGGDFKISLQEVRSQFYFLLAYLMAVNMVQEKQHVGTLLWIMALCIGLKGIFYVVRRYVVLGGLDLPDQGVGSHEEAFFFDTFLALLLVLALCGVQKRLQRVMWLLLPAVLLGNLACHRRAATAALAIALPLLLVAAARALPARRKLVTGIGLALLAGFAVYYPLCKDSTAAYAQPANAIRSQFAPDQRDLSSNTYRDAENADLMATIHSAPLQGYGYGKRMLHAVPIADISQQYIFWDILPHNQILWVWMRVGTLGFWAFWVMIAAILIRACRTIRGDTLDADGKAAGLFVLLAVVMLLLFGLLDLQLSNFRDMLFTGFWTGVLAALPAVAGAGRPLSGRQGLSEGPDLPERASPPARRPVAALPGPGKVQR